MPNGKLTIKKEGQPTLTFTSIAGYLIEATVRWKNIEESYRSKLKADQNAAKPNWSRPDEVSFELESGQPVKIRPRSTATGTVVPVVSVPAQQGIAPRNPAAAAPPVPVAASVPVPTANVPAQGFYNPYNFIHGRDRSGLSPEPKIPRGLGDGKPFGHHALHSDLYTGTITIKLKTATPLLIVDAETQERAATGHPTFAMCKDKDGKPLLRPASVKGMLSSCYEAITNSRLRVFDKHDGRLAKRMNPKKGITLVPARIEDGKIMLYPGTSTINEHPAGAPTGNLMYAAWLPRHRGQHNSRTLLQFQHGGEPQHNAHVECWIEKFEHHGWDRDHGRHNLNFHFWRVREIVSYGNPGLSPNSPIRTGQPSGNWQPRKNYHVSTGTFKKVSGYVFVSNANIGNKHDERVFFVEQPTLKIDAGPAADMADRWKDLISDYQEIHRDEIEKKGRTGPPSMANCVWSRHIGDGRARSINRDERKLEDGTLCYVQVAKNNGIWKAEDIFPVNISRELFEKSPRELTLRGDLLPAESIGQLSPADRVFGWVRQNLDNTEATHENDPNAVAAHKGQLRIGNVTCDTAEETAIKRFDGFEIPLAILSGPKPSQASFYVMDETGRPLIEKNRGYSHDHQIRHRKFYPHHKLAGDPSNSSYWSNPTQDRTQTRTVGLMQEYRQPHKGIQEEVIENGRQIKRLQRNADRSFVLNETEGSEQRTDQNRSITEWVKIGTEFTSTIHVTNLSQVELGALLWMLSLDKEFHGQQHFLRMGGAKPLGFGSVSCEITSSDLRSGNDWKSYYLDLGDAADAVDAVGQNVLKSAAIAAYKLEVSTAYKSANEASFESIDFIDAFLGCCRGLDGPVHYPRTEQWRDPDGNNFEWFKEAQRNNRNPKVGLPKLTTQTPRLPYWQ